ncbi:MAG: TIGR00153 family protein [Elusimicrobiota bacterium]
MIFGNKKEKKVEETINKHLKTVCETIKSMQATIDCYLAQDIEGADNNAYHTHELESVADSLRREIIEGLYNGAFMPRIREDFVKYIARQDKIADGAESCCDYVVSQKPRVPAEYSEEINKLAEASCRTLDPLRTAVEDFFKDYKAARDSIKEVNIKEELADTIEWHLTESIFQSDTLSLAEKIHLREFVFHVVHISDLIEDAADFLDSILVKRMM